MTTTTTTTTATATAALFVAMVPAGASAASITDLAVSGEVTALALGSIGPSFAEPEPARFSESNDQQSTSFGEFPLSVSALADPETSGGILPFSFADASADLNVERTPTGVEGSLQLTGGGGFTQTSALPFLSGFGASTATFSYSFLVDAQTAFELTTRTGAFMFIPNFNNGVDVFARLIDDATGNTLADLDGVVGPIQVEATSGLLEPGTYTLLVDAFAEIGESDFSDRFTFSLNFSEVEAPNPIPSPAALPAGLALLCGLTARRKR